MLLINIHSLSDWGSVASLAGLIITFGGFIWTIIGVSKSRRAAEAAQDAAQKSREDFQRLDTVSILSSTISMMDEIRRLARESAWRVMPDRFSEIRRGLAAAKTIQPGLSQEAKQQISGAIRQMRNMEDRIEKALTETKEYPEIARLNRILSDQSEKLHAILTELKTEIGSDS